MAVYSKLVVGIFSREAEDAYQWLQQLLLSPQFRSLVRDVRPVLISNAVTGGSWRLAQEIRKCSFAILYHSLTRGRLNVTNVTDSLYDHELRHLHRELGREKVVVLVDDLQSDDRTAWNRILLEQPLIGECAGLLLVVYRDEKPLHGAEGGAYQRSGDHATKKKIESLRTQLQKGRTLNWRSVALFAFGLVLLILIVVLCVELIH